VGQFSYELSLSKRDEKDNCVPLSVALDYIGAILDESSTETSRLKNDVQEYSQMRNSMETEILELLSPPAINESTILLSGLEDLVVDDVHNHLGTTKSTETRYLLVTATTRRDGETKARRCKGAQDKKYIRVVQFS